MTFFSRCDVSQRYEPRYRASLRRRARRRAGPLAALVHFAEDLGILFRYAAGLDYYGRHRLHPKD